jgi:TM2 domain-containing membrane protein YozV|tara:strand:- start:988 stop:1200 length:213 start_codon:yes stop_codon:yes gene_type:complete
MEKIELMKSRKTAMLLAIFLGYLGIHRFYLGQIGLGVLYLCTGGFLILPIIDFFIWLLGSQESFDDKYNK